MHNLSIVRIEIEVGTHLRMLVRDLGGVERVYSTSWALMHENMW